MAAFGLGKHGFYSWMPQRSIRHWLIRWRVLAQLCRLTEPCAPCVFQKASFMSWSFAVVASSGCHTVDLCLPPGVVHTPQCQATEWGGQYATNHFCIAPPLAESGAHRMDSLMKEPSAQLCVYSIMPLPNGPPFYFNAFSHYCTTKTCVLDEANGDTTGQQWAQCPKMANLMTFLGFEWA